MTALAYSRLVAAGAAAPAHGPRLASRRRARLFAGLVTGALALLSSTAPVTHGAEGQARATFAGGCFWCVEPAFDKVPGVLSTTSGYAGGIVPHPTYEQVSAGGTGHAEVVQVVYDPEKVSYEKLLEVFWRNVDPLDGGGQFCDRGLQYRSAIFYENEEQKQAALRSRERLEQSGRLPGPVKTGVVPLTAFYPAEEYHQDYYIKNVRKYWAYRAGCRRDERLKQLWGEKKD